MGWPAEQLVLPSELRDSILRGECCVFIGSGPSIPTYGSWTTLVNNLCNTCGSQLRVEVSSSADDFLDAAQDAKTRDCDAYMMHLGRHFGSPPKSADLVYDHLASLPFRSYLTTNFDPLLAIKVDFSMHPAKPLIRHHPHLRYAAIGNKSVHYLHGLIREREYPAIGPIVLAREDFEDAYRPDSSLRRFLIDTLLYEQLLFIGCQLKEPALHRVLDICRREQKERIQHAAALGKNPGPLPSRFILLPKVEAKDPKDQFDRGESERQMEEISDSWLRLNIRTIWYVKSEGDHSAVREALGRLANRKDIEPDYSWHGGIHA